MIKHTLDINFKTDCRLSFNDFINEIYNDTAKNISNKLKLTNNYCFYENNKWKYTLLFNDLESISDVVKNLENYYISNPNHFIKFTPFFSIQEYKHHEVNFLLFEHFFYYYQKFLSNTKNHFFDIENHKCINVFFIFSLVSKLESLIDINIFFKFFKRILIKEFEKSVNESVGKICLIKDLKSNDNVLFGIEIMNQTLSLYNEIDESKGIDFYVFYLHKIISKLPNQKKMLSLINFLKKMSQIQGLNNYDLLVSSNIILKYINETSMRNF